MALDRPQSLASLLSPERAGKPEAWEAFADQYSRLLLGTCKRASGRGYDGMMDRYAYVLEQLRIDDYRRLRTYSPDGRTKFTTWLVVVTARLCVDFDRRLYGRDRAKSNGRPGVVDSLLLRRNLADLVSVELDHSRLPDPSMLDPETAAVVAEVRGVLSDAVSNLSPQDRLLLAFRFEHDATMQDLSDVMGLPSRFHAYRRLKLVLGSLRRSLEGNGIEERDT